MSVHVETENQPPIQGGVKALLYQLSKTGNETLEPYTMDS